MRARVLLILACSGALGVWTPARAAQQLDVSPSPIPAFNETCVGQAATVTITLTNNDPDTDVTLRDVFFDPASSHFTVLGFSSSSPEVIARGGDTFSFQVRFAPSSVGNHTTQLKFDTSGNAAPNPMDVRGTGVSRALEIAPPSVVFGEQRVGSRSESKQITLKNTGSSDLTISKAALSGAGTGDFRLSGFSGTQKLGPNQSVDVSVSFQPRIAGKRSTTLAVTSNACAGPTKSLSISGTGIAPRIRIDPPLVDLGQTPLGTPSEQVPVVVSNDGKAPLKVSDIQIVGGDASDFAFQALPTLPRTVAAGDSFLLNVIFTPSGDGRRRTGARITSDDPAAPIFEITLTGVGGGASIPPTTSPTATPTPTPTRTTSPPPRASRGAGTGGDWLAIGLVVSLVGFAFAGLVVLRRVRGDVS